MVRPKVPWHTGLRSATTPGVVLTTSLAAVAVGIGATELPGATRLLVRLASSTLLLALVALAVAADETDTGALLAEAQEAMGHANHLLRSCDTSVTTETNECSQTYNSIFYK